MVVSAGKVAHLQRVGILSSLGKFSIYVGTCMHIHWGSILWVLLLESHTERRDRRRKYRKQPHPLPLCNKGWHEYKILTGLLLELHDQLSSHKRTIGEAIHGSVGGQRYIYGIFI